MAPLIDISVRLHNRSTAWPSSPGFRRNLRQEIRRGDRANGSEIHMDVHCGTHVEAPWHFIEGGQPMASISLDVLVGPALVVDLRGCDQIGPEALNEVVPHDLRLERLLLRTTNSDRWTSRTDFDPQYAALSLEGARWIVDRGVRLVGADYLSVQRFEDDPETHRVLMRAGIAILEGLDLSGAEPAMYRLTCLPLHIPDAEAAPARAILEELP